MLDLCLSRLLFSFIWFFVKLLTILIAFAHSRVEFCAVVPAEFCITPVWSLNVI